MCQSRTMTNPTRRLVPPWAEPTHRTNLPRRVAREEQHQVQTLPRGAANHLAVAVQRREPGEAPRRRLETQMILRARDQTSLRMMMDHRAKGRAPLPTDMVQQTTKSPYGRGPLEVLVV